MAIPMFSSAIASLHHAVKLDSPRSGDESALLDIFSDVLRTAGQATDVSSYAVAEDEKEQQAVVFQEETAAFHREPLFDFLPLNPLQTMQQDLTVASVLHMKPESIPPQQTGFSRPAVNTPVQNVNGFDDAAITDNSLILMEESISFLHESALSQSVDVFSGDTDRTAAINHVYNDTDAGLNLKNFSGADQALIERHTRDVPEVLARPDFSKRAFLKGLPQDNHQSLVFPAKVEAMSKSLLESNQTERYFQPLPPSPYVKPTQDGQWLGVNNALNHRIDAYDPVPFSACLDMDDDQSPSPAVELSPAYPQAVAVAREALEASHAAVIKTQNPVVHEKGFPDSAALYTQHIQDSGGVGTDTMLTKAQLKIYQADLGEVVAKIEIFDHKTTLNLVTESSNVRDLLEAHMTTLKNNFLQVDQMPLETHVEHHFSDDKRQQRPQPDTVNAQTSAQATVFEKKRELEKTSLIDAYI